MCAARTCARRRRQLRQDKKSRRMWATRGIARVVKSPERKKK